MSERPTMYTKTFTIHKTAHKRCSKNVKTRCFQSPQKKSASYVLFSRKEVWQMRRSRALLRPALFSVPLSEPALHKQDGCNRRYNSGVFQMLQGLSKDRVVSSFVRELKLNSVDLLRPRQACQLSREGVWKYLLSIKIADSFELWTYSVFVRSKFPPSNLSVKISVPLYFSCFDLA